MNCIQARGKISSYIDDKLSDKELSAFIGHVEDCQECYHELETFFMIDRVVKYLDEDDDACFDMRSLLPEDLEKKNKKLRDQNRRKNMSITLIVVAVIVLLMMILDAFGIVGFSYLI